MGGTGQCTGPQPSMSNIWATVACRYVCKESVSPLGMPPITCVSLFSRVQGIIGASQLLRLEGVHELSGICSMRRAHASMACMVDAHRGHASSKRGFPTVPQAGVLRSRSHKLRLQQEPALKNRRRVSTSTHNGAIARPVHHICTRMPPLRSPSEHMIPRSGKCMHQDVGDVPAHCCTCDHKLRQPQLFGRALQYTAQCPIPRQY